MDRESASDRTLPNILLHWGSWDKPHAIRDYHTTLHEREGMIPFHEATYFLSLVI